jgi:fructokinase
MRSSLTGIGEVLWDLLPGGRQLGGAPANFTCHAAGLGARARLVTRLGRDPLGEEALDRLAARGIPPETLERDDTLPTGTVGVEVGPGGQPRFEIHVGAAWDALRGEEAGLRAVSEADAVCFGTLGQRSEVARATIRRLMGSCSPGALRILDVNLRAPFHSPDLIVDSLARANVLKLNDTELPVLSAVMSLTGAERERIAAIAGRFQLRCVAYTRGSAGSLLFRDGQWSDHPGSPTRVVDTVGAGDSFTAAMTLGLLAGWDLDRINDAANRVASFVCTQAGATPELPSELRGLFQG